jgi:hypothetical protein
VSLALVHGVDGGLVARIFVDLIQAIEFALQPADLPLVEVCSRALASLGRALGGV